MKEFEILVQICDSIRVVCKRLHSIYIMAQSQNSYLGYIKNE